jgi:hypothetical protein
MRRIRRLGAQFKTELGLLFSMFELQVPDLQTELKKEAR